jgi:alcohol dehydrogenase (NADP+)
MLPTRGYAAMAVGSPMEPFNFSRRDVGPHDVLIQIRYCGICHSDLHQVRDEWGGSQFPLVPGHEIVGTVTQIGSAVTAFHDDDTVGVGCFVDSCRECLPCRQGLEQYCERHCVFTYNGTEKDGHTPTYGGYSNQIVIDERYVLRIPERLAPECAAPLLCAGITTYSPLRYWNVGKGQRLGVVGLGGLGHMAIKFGAAFGAEVTVFSHSEHKRGDAKRLGAADFADTSDPETFSKLTRHFDVIIDTVSAAHDYSAYLELLKTDGTMILVGAPDKPAPLEAFPLIMRRRRLVGSMIGGIRETQDMLDFCATHDIVSDVEVIAIQQIDTAYERMLKGDVRYRFVIDLNTLME